MTAITLDRLRKQFGAVPAVRDISLTFEDGKMTAVLGPSGCGKTTTLNMIAGFVRPDAGSIRFGDRVIADPARRIDVPSHRRELGMVFQSYALWPHLSIAENVGYGLRMRGIGRAERDGIVRRALARVRLAAMTDRYPHELSGGQQQRVALARAIAYVPQILLFDEPLSNLDARLREELRSELKALHGEIGVTAVYVTHDQAEALALSDQIAVMHSGRLQQFGTPDEVYTRPRNRVVADFMGHVNFLAGNMEPGGLVRLGGGEPIRLAAPGAIAPGTPVELAVRPEDVILGPAAGQPNGAMTARVAVRTFLGNINEYFVTLSSGETVRAQTPPKLNFAVGDTVALSFDLVNISVFPRAP